MGMMWIFGALVGWFVVSHFISGPIVSIACKDSGLALRGQASQSRVVRSAYSYGR